MAGGRRGPYSSILNPGSYGWSKDIQLAHAKDGAILKTKL